MARLLVFLMVPLGLLLSQAMARHLPAKGEVSVHRLLAAADAPASSAIAEGPEGVLHGATNHRPDDKSKAGAEVILGGLATAIFFAIFAYIRVTRKSSDAKA